MPKNTKISVFFIKKIKNFKYFLKNKLICVNKFFANLKISLSKFFLLSFVAKYVKNFSVAGL